jgi:hypothetical protein
MKITEITARIHENGNGLPNIGELCYDPSTDSIYRIAAWDGSSRISTHAPGVGNSVDVVLEHVCSASDASDAEWEEIESTNYRVTVRNH